MAGLLRTELNVEKNMQVAKEINDLVEETGQNPITLELWQLPEISSHWQDVTIITLADQAHANRPQGGSTGGLWWSSTCLWRSRKVEHRFLEGLGASSSSNFDE